MYPKAKEIYNIPDEVFDVASKLGISVYVDSGTKIGDYTRIWHNSHIASDAQIGDNCVIGQNCYIAGVVGNRCRIQNNVSIFKGVCLEDDVFVGPNAVFTNILTPRAFVNRKDEFIPTLIKKGASIGAGAIIICGNTIGRYAMIGAGSVVTKNVSEYNLVCGNPARVRGTVYENGEVVKMADG